MSILRITKGKPTPDLRPDPLRYLNPQTIQPPIKMRPPRKPKGSVWSTLGIASVVTLGIIGGAIWMVSRERPKERPFVYFELRAINDGGHPLPGVEILGNQKRLGLTDSFGEWRKYLRVPLGSAVHFELSKDYPSGAIKASKTFSIPRAITQKGTLEMTGTVQLTSAQSAVAATRPVAPIATKAPIAVPAPAVVPVPLAPPPELSTQQTTRIGFSIGDERSEVLSNVMHALEELSSAEGWLVDPKSPWRVRLQHLAYPRDPTFVGLIRVTSVDDHGIVKEFLRNYEGVAQLSAKTIFTALSKPPVGTGPAHRLQLYGLNDPSAGIFVGGDKLVEKEGQRWIYHSALPSTYVTIVRGNAIAFRKLISNAGPNTVVSVPQSPVALRP